jgi:hypothetical protein
MWIKLTAISGEIVLINFANVDEVRRSYKGERGTTICFNGPSLDENMPNVEYVRETVTEIENRLGNAGLMV